MHAECEMLVILGNEPNKIWLIFINIAPSDSILTGGAFLWGDYGTKMGVVI